jgi:hypothetical protein
LAQALPTLLDLVGQRGDEVGRQEQCRRHVSIADILGRTRPSMTQDVYMGRHAVSRDGADALYTALGTHPE